MNAQLEHVVHEVYANEADAIATGATVYPSGHSTYRIYAELSDVQNSLQAVLGIPDLSDLEIGTDNGVVWNYTPNTGAQSIFGEQINPDLCFALVEDFAWWYDSFVTIGSSDNTFVGAENIAEYSLTGVPGVDFNIPVEDFWDSTPYSDPVINKWTARNSGWLTLVDQAPNSLGIGPDLRVLLAQITTTGSLEYKLNLMINDLPIAEGGVPHFYISEEYCEDYGLWGVEIYTVSEMGLVNPVFNCADPDACNFNSNPDFDTNNSYCNYLECEGCTDINFCNYDPCSTIDDGSCLGSAGCPNEFADNYDPAAQCFDAELCIFFGCSDPNFCEYNSQVTDDDGSCLTLPSCGIEYADNYDPDYLCSDNALCTIGGCMDSSFCNFDPIATYDNGSCSNIPGCIDPSAVNYNLMAACPDQCIYHGCSDSLALNYLPNASEDDGSCIYGLGGIVFLDQNENGIMDMGEPGIENWTLDILGLGLSTYTADGGEFAFGELSPGSISIALEVQENWTATTDVTVELFYEEGVSGYINFGVVPDSDDYSFFNAQECCIFLPQIHCDWGFYPGVWFHNAGTAPLNGTISLTWDPTLQGVPQLNSVEPDILVDGYCEWQLVNYLPGFSDIFRIRILGPGFEYIGQFFDFELSFDFEDFNGSDFSSGILLQPEVVCSYDPNDKYAEPEGYSEEHFILPDEEIQYRIRFQNTGNFPAGQVIVRDTLSSLLDFETF